MNTGPEPAEVTFTIAGARTVAPTAAVDRAVVAESDGRELVRAAAKIVPVTTTVTGLGRIVHADVLPPYSLSILRVKVK